MRDPVKAKAYQSAWYVRNRVACIERARAWTKAREHAPAERAKRMLGNVKGRAMKNGLPYDLTREWALPRLLAGCELTGLPFDLRPGGKVQPYSPSVDRIDPALGYIQSNCRLVITAVNFAKNVWTDDVLLTWAAALVARSTTQ